MRLIYSNTSSYLFAAHMTADVLLLLLSTPYNITTRGTLSCPCSAVEFPAVLLSVGTGAVEGEFHHFIQPQENTTLSAFCTELTGISQVCACVCV